MKISSLPSLLMAGVLMISLGACKDNTFVEKPQDTSTKDSIVLMSTAFGNMYLYMYKGTPLHRKNFHKLVSEGFYDNTEFHRIIPKFMIQGGDPLSKDSDRTNDGTGGPGYTIPAEINTAKYTHILGAVAAARTNNPEKASSGSQFYIVVDEPGTASLNNNYTVFGRVIKGVEVAETIVNQPRNSKDLPDTRIKMTCKIVPKTHDQLLAEFEFVAE